jgi:Cytochrome C oxidase, cbb3-type, subunit III
MNARERDKRQQADAASPRVRRVSAASAGRRTLRGMRARREALLVLAVAVAGCGGGTSTTPEQTPSGAEVFSKSCTSCHSLIGNESLHRPGGDLLGYRLSREQLFEQVREMPVRHSLTKGQLAAVVDYVYALERAAR